MSFKPFFDESLVDEIVEVTDGALVRYRGDEFYMHCEQPTHDILEAFDVVARGAAQILIGPRSRFPEVIERGTLIEVDGDDWTIADHMNSEDGYTIFIALTRQSRITS